MTYNRDSRLVKYENDVDIRQGTDRILGGIANIYLDERNELSRSEIQNNVTITQPNRKQLAIMQSTLLRQRASFFAAIRRESMMRKTDRNPELR
jgi:hypothetical protein